MSDLLDDSRLRDLLEHVADPASGSGHVELGAELGADLRRGRTALRERRRRTLSAGLGALTTLAVLGVGTAAVVTSQSDPARDIEAGTPSSPRVESATPDEPDAQASQKPTKSPAVDPGVVKVRLVAQKMEAGPYTFGTTPQGWNVLHNGAFGVTIARADDPDQSWGSFVGKLVVMLDNDPLDFLGGKPAGVVDGRQMYIADNGGGHLLASVSTLPGEPGKTVRIQFPADMGWTQDAALRFLASVRVGPGAQIAVG